MAFSGIGIAMIIGLFYSAFTQQPMDMKWLAIGVGLNLISLIAVIIDLIRNPVQNKIMWVLLLSTMTMLATFAYLIMRDKIVENQPNT